MRNEKEMMSLILDIAKKDERIRAVYMNGSRTNVNAPKDIFQDYDIVYVVKETRPFAEDKEWLNVFGERLYMQCPDEVDMWLGEEPHMDEYFGWLIQFTDGNRLDLHVVPVHDNHVLDDKLCVVLLDKDNVLPKLPAPTDEDYRINRPTEGEFWAVCNEFWWCLNNVAKGMWREEYTYVQDMLSQTIRPQLTTILNWKVGYENDFQISTGKASKYLYRYLSKEDWNRYLATWSGCEKEAFWKAIFTMCDLFQETALNVATSLQFTYNEQEANASYEYLKHVRTLPKDVTEIF